MNETKAERRSFVWLGNISWKGRGEGEGKRHDPLIKGEHRAIRTSGERRDRKIFL